MVFLFTSVCFCLAFSDRYHVDGNSFCLSRTYHERIVHVQDLRPGVTAFWLQSVGRMQKSSGPSSVPVVPPSQDLWGIFLHLFFCSGES